MSLVDGLKEAARLARDVGAEAMRLQRPLSRPMEVWEIQAAFAESMARMFDFAASREDTDPAGSVVCPHCGVKRWR